jgi:hypothetical protein
MTAIDPDIQALFDRLEQLFASADFAAMSQLWATDAPLLYLAEEETSGFLTDWPAVADYFRRTEVAIADLRARYVVQHVIALAPTLRQVAFEMDWAGTLGTQPRTGGHVRGTAVVETTEHGLRLRSYVEAPLAPVLYVRWLSQQYAKGL